MPRGGARPGAGRPKRTERPSSAGKRRRRRGFGGARGGARQGAGRPTKAEAEARRLASAALADREPELDLADVLPNGSCS